MNAVKQTGGAYVRVSDDEILAALPVLARGSGVFAEPAGAAAYAGLQAAVAAGLVGADGPCCASSPPAAASKTSPAP